MEQNAASKYWALTATDSINRTTRYRCSLQRHCVPITTYPVGSNLRQLPLLLLCWCLCACWPYVGVQSCTMPPLPCWKAVPWTNEPVEPHIPDPTSLCSSPLFFSLWTTHNTWPSQVNWQCCCILPRMTLRPGWWLYGCLSGSREPTWTSLLSPTASSCKPARSILIWDCCSQSKGPVLL